MTEPVARAPWKKVSASQIESWNRCKRTWFNGSILKDRSPPSAAQQRGTDIHRVLERVLTEPVGFVPPEQERVVDPFHVALAGAAFNLRRNDDPDVFVLPRPFGEETYMSEHPLEMESYPGGPIVTGFIDLVAPLRPEVFDFKTLSDFRYAKTPGELADSVQMVLYAWWLISHFTGTSDVRLTHVQLLTRGKTPRAASSFVTLTRAQVEDRWVRILDTIRQMQAVADDPNITSALQLDPTVSACDAYGGCYYRPKCGLTALAFAKPSSPTDTENTSMSQLRETLKARIAASKAAAAGEAAPAEVAPVADPAPSPASAAATPPPATPSPASAAATPPPATPAAELPRDAGVPQLKDCPACGGRKFVKSTDPESGIGAFKNCGACRGSGKVAYTPVPAPEPGAPAEGILSPDSPPREELPQGEVVDPATVKAAKAERKSKKTDASAATPAASAPPAQAAAAPPATPPAAAAAPPATPSPAAATPSARSIKSTRLFVDCVPTRREDGLELVFLEDWIAPVAKAVADHGKVMDWRQIPYSSRGDLAVGIKLAIDQAGLPANIVIDSRQSGAEVFLEVVTPFALQVVRGLR